MSHEPLRGRFDKFTESARKVFLLSQEEARDLSHHEMGTEHLLLGVAREARTVFTVLLNVDLDQLRNDVRAQFRPHNTSADLPDSPTEGWRSVIYLAAFSSTDREEKFIGISHLVNGLARVGVFEGFRLELGFNLLTKLCQEGNIPTKDFVDQMRQLES